MTMLKATVIDFGGSGEQLEDVLNEYLAEWRKIYPNRRIVFITSSRPSLDAWTTYTFFYKDDAEVLPVE